MKPLSKLVLGAFTALLSLSGARAEVLGIKTVYVLPMAGGLDQYLALKLTSEGVLQVVTDPKRADAILTDAIGGRLEDRLDELYVAPVEADKEKTDREKTDKAATPEFAHPAMRPLSRSQGLVFLVNRHSRDVVWSTFVRSKSSQPEQLNHVAGKIVDRMARAQKK